MEEKIPPPKLIILRLLVALVILICGIAVQAMFAKMKKPPAKKKVFEVAVSASVSQIAKGLHTIKLHGYGNLQSHKKINMSTEVSGKIIYTNPKLEKGLHINEGDILLKIDPQDYQLAVDLQTSRIAVLNAQRKDLQEELKFASDSLILAKDSVRLTENEYNRQKALFQNKIGSLELVEVKEKNLIATREKQLNSNKNLSSLKNKILTLDKQLEEAHRLKDIEARNIEKCSVLATQNLRVIDKNVEVGQYVSPGFLFANFEDDQQLEIPVLLSGPDAVKWLPRKENEKNIFKSVLKTDADIIWIEENEEKLLATGKMTRIEEYDSSSRMLKAVVSIEKQKQPIAAGMFCKVSIKGLTLTEVIKVPRISVSTNNELFTVENSRLKLRPVKILHDEGDHLIIDAKDFPPSLKIINSKITTPLEGMKIISEQLDDQR